MEDDDVSEELLLLLLERFSGVVILFWMDGSFAFWRWRWCCSWLIMQLA